MDTRTNAESEISEKFYKPTRSDVKAAVQELLKHGLLESDRNPKLFKLTLQRHSEIQPILDPLDFELVLDDKRGIAYLAPRHKDPDTDLSDEPSDQTHPLVRRQRFNLEQSLVIALLRQQFLSHELEYADQTSYARFSAEELNASLLLYMQSTGSDSLDNRRLTQILEQLRVHKLVTQIDDAGRFGIRPLIAHVGDPASLSSLLDHYKEVADDIANDR
ncbi:MAG: DUF4194 domain-containing protein [Pseudomonadales bacterium]|nr:DUF4194 domain-containing protein [Pseudomonadales bacterium]